MLNFEKFMKENDLTFESDILDPAFVVKAKDLQQRIADKSITEEEITAIDAELMEMLNQLEIVEIQSPEILKEKRKARLSEAREKIASAETIEALDALESEYEDLKELGPFIDKRRDKVKKAIQQVQADQEYQAAVQVISEANFEDLENLLKQYSADERLVKLIKGRIEKEKVKTPQGGTLREKLLNAKRREWTYDQLKEIGITATGNNMDIEGVTLTKRYLFLVYTITAVDGKNV